MAEGSALGMIECRGFAAMVEASDAMVKAARVELKAMEKTGGPLTIATRLKGAAFIIEVSDDGPGIPEATLEKIFDPFYTTKAPGKGTGLGLSVSFTIVESLGGSLRAEHNADGGTRMVIVLPLAESPTK